MATKVFDLYGAITLDKGKVSSDIKDVEKQAVTAAKNIEKSFGEGFKRGFGQAGDAMEELGSKAGRLAGLVSNPWAAAAAAVGGFSVALVSATKAAAAFEQEFAKSRVFLAGTPAQIAAVEKSLAGLDARLGSSSVLLPTFRKALLDSADPKVALEMTKLAASFAKVTDTTPTQAVGLLGDLMDSFGIKADKASRITDVLFLTMKQGGGDVAELAANFPRLADAAAESSIQIEELGAALATLGQVAGSSPQKNIQALILLLTSLSLNAAKFRERNVDVQAFVSQFGELGGRLRAIRAFATDAETGLLSKERLRELGVNFRNLNATLKLISDEGLATLTEKTKQFERDAPGATASAFSKISATVQAEFDRLGTEIQKLKETIGAPLLIPIKFAIESAADVVKATREIIATAQAESQGRGAAILDAQGGRLRELSQSSPGSQTSPFPVGLSGLGELLAAGKDRSRAELTDSARKMLAGQPGFAGRARQRSLEAGLAADMARAEGESLGTGAPQGDTFTDPEKAVRRALAAAIRDRELAARVGRFELEARAARRGGNLGPESIDRAAAATVAGLRAKIGGLSAEQGQLGLLIGRGEGGPKEQHLAQIQTLQKEAEALERQILDVQRDAAAEKVALAKRTADEMLKLNVDAIEKERVARDRFFDAEVALGRKSIEIQIARNRIIAADLSLTADQRYDALVAATQLEQKLEEDLFELRKTLNAATIEEEISLWATRARLAEHGSQVQISALQRVAALTRQQRDEARGLMQELLGLGKSERVSQNSLARTAERQRDRDRNVRERYAVGGSVNREALIGAEGRRDLWERVGRAGGIEAALAPSSGNLAGMFAAALRPPVASIPPSLGGNGPTSGHVPRAEQLFDAGTLREQPSWFQRGRFPGLESIFPEPPMERGRGGNTPFDIAPYDPAVEQRYREHMNTMPGTPSPGSSLGISPAEITAAIDAVRRGMDELEKVVVSGKSRIGRGLADIVSDFIADDLETVRG